MSTIQSGPSSAPTIQFSMRIPYIQKKKEYDLENLADVQKMIKVQNNQEEEKANQKENAKQLAASYQKSTDAACKALVQVEKVQVETQAPVQAKGATEKKVKKYDILPLATRFTELMKEKQELDKSSRTDDTKTRRTLVEESYTTILAVLSGRDTDTAVELSKNDQKALVNSLAENSSNIDEDTSKLFSKILGKRIENGGKALNKDALSQILTSRKAWSIVSGLYGLCIGGVISIVAPPIGIPIIIAGVAAGSVSPVAKLVNKIYRWRTGKNLKPFRKAQ